MSSKSTLLQESDLESLQSDSSRCLNADNEEAINKNVRKHITSAESKLKVKPLSLKFTPRYAAAGDQFWRAAQELIVCRKYLQSCSIMQRSADCYVKAGQYVRAAKVLDYALSVLLENCQEDVKIVQLMNTVDSAHSLYLKINQIDDSVRVLELAANHFLRESHSSSKENLDKGLNLLQRAVDILENEARPSQAGTLAMRMMTIGLEAEMVGPEMIQLGKRCLKMFVMTNNVTMTGNCLIMLNLLLIKHFENEAEDEAKQLYNDNIGNDSTEVRNLVKIILKALEERDFSKIDEVKESFSKLKTDNTTKAAVISAMSSLVNNNIENDNTEKEALPDQSDDKRFTIEPRRPNIGLTKVLAVATGAAVVASSVAGLKYDKTALREKNVTSLITPHSDVTGYEAFHQVKDLGHTESSFREESLP